MINTKSVRILVIIMFCLFMISCSTNKIQYNNYFCSKKLIETCEKLNQEECSANPQCIPVGEAWWTEGESEGSWFYYFKECSVRTEKYANCEFIDIREDEFARACK